MKKPFCFIAILFFFVFSICAQEDANYGPPLSGPVFELTGELGIQFLLGGYMKEFGDLLLDPDPDSYVGVDIGVSMRVYPLDFFGLEVGYAIIGVISATKDDYDSYAIYNTSILYGGPTFRLMLHEMFGISAGGGVSFNFLSWDPSLGGTTDFDPGLGWYLKAQCTGYLWENIIFGIGLQYNNAFTTNETGTEFDGQILKFILTFGFCF